MKRHKWFSILAAGVLSFLVSWGGIGCMVTAFHMPVDLTGPALWCALFSAALALGFGTRLWPLPLGALALAGGYLWRKGVLELSVMRLLRDLSEVYDRAYGWGVLTWDGTDLTGGDPELALLAAGALICAVITWTVCRRRRSWLAVPIGLAPLAACLVVTDTVPDLTWIFLLILGLGLLIMTQSTRRRDEVQGNRLTGMLAVPLALALGLLCLAVPRETYDGQMGGELLYQRFLDLCSTVSGELALDMEGPGWYAGEAGENVDLSLIGPKIDRYTPVMEVTAATDGTLYLRGRAYDTYDGKNWTVSDLGWMEDSVKYWGDNGNILGDVTVTTRNLHTVLYLPYNGADDAVYNKMYQGRLENRESSLSYSFTQVEAPTPDNFITYDWVRDPPYNIQTDQYLALPEETRQRAAAFLVENIPQCGDYLAGIEYREYEERFVTSSVSISMGSRPEYQFLELDEHGIPIPPENYDVISEMSINAIRQELLLAIMDFVQNSAEYSLRTPRMPEEETDFALWFLEDSDTGYCVHYATAATVLLRAAGFDARYVSGYMVEARAGRTVTVREKDAHAWVEAYLPTSGWIMLEVTGGMGDENVPETTVPVTTTGATETSETTMPPAAETTRPEETTSAPRPTEPGRAPEEPPDLTWLWTVLKGLAGTLLALGVVIGQWRLRLWLRWQGMHRGTVNAQALARWKETERLCRLLKEEPGEHLRELAQKAKFSQHTLTREELGEFDRAIADARNQLRQKPVYQQVIHRVLFAAW